MHILTDVLQFTLNAATHPPVLLVPCAWKIIAILTCHQLCLCLPIPVPCVFILWFFQVYCNILCIGVTRKWDHETWSHDVDKNFGQVKLGSLPGACEAFWLFDPNIPSSLTETSNKKWCYLASVSDFRDFRSNKTWAQQQIKQVVFSLSLGGGCPLGEADAKTSGSQGLKQSESSI